jgi:hypothetical protein
MIAGCEGCNRANWQCPKNLEKTLRSFLLALAVMLSGCAAQVATVNVPGIERSAPVRIADLRPAREKQGEVFSVLVSSDAYATCRVPDSAVVPPATRIFQHRAFDKFGAGSGPPEIKLHHFVICRNIQAEQRRGVMGAVFGGVIGLAVAAQIKQEPPGTVSSLVDSKAFEALCETQFKGALYSEQENPGCGSVHIVYIETEIQGKRAFTRTMVPILANSEESPLVPALDAATSFHLARY